MTKRRGNLLAITIFILLSVISALILFFSIPRSPKEQVEIAREKLSSAQKFGADIYAGGLYFEARLHYDSAMTLWHKENTRLLWLRDYKRVEELARISASEAVQSAEKSELMYNSMKNKFIQKKDSLNSLISEMNILFRSYPLDEMDISRISKGKLLLKEAEIEYSKERLFKALTKIQDSEYMLKESFKNAKGSLHDYFESYSIWKIWMEKTVLNSRTKREYSIIVDKFSRKCYVYYSGVRKYEFDIELGKNWVGKKRVRGDKATPEGMYKILKKIDTGRTKYYKALLLDYPNSEDKERFRSEISNGTIPVSSDIGSMIEIHGDGGKGTDWTDGCIALTDKDMDLIFKISRVGTQITIVGSIKSLDEIYKKYLH